MSWYQTMEYYAASKSVIYVMERVLDLLCDKNKLTQRRKKKHRKKTERIDQTVYPGGETSGGLYFLLYAYLYF